MRITKIFILHLLAFSISFTCKSNMQESSSQDPLSGINYRNAFNQTKIHAQFRNLMERLGCAANVFDETNASSGTSFPVSQEILDEELQFEQACLKQLQLTRWWTITAPAQEAIVFMVLEAAAAAILVKTMKSNSVGGSFGVFATLFDSVFLVRNIVNSCFTLARPPEHPLNTLEELFVKNQCFIPRVLWPIITEKFMLARSNQFEQRKTMEYIEFALGLTTYKPKPAVRFKYDIGLDDGIRDLFAKIDQFFDDYKAMNESHITRWILKHNVYKFVNALQGNEMESPHYIYLYGPGGIGKTCFIHQLCDWINELIPGSIHFEEITVTSVDELEGSQARPGVLLCAFRNQLMANKRGSIIFMDEATWLNDGGMISAAKRVFNGDQSKLSTTYFGTGIDGTGITLKIPPMLIFVACNEPIKDVPLQSRFDTIPFPMPKTDALVRHAYEICTANKLLQQLQNATDRNTIEHWIIENNIDNFRDAAAKVVPFALSLHEVKETVK